MSIPSQEAKILSRYISSGQLLSSLPAQGVLKLYIAAFEDFLSSKISLDDFSSVCHFLWQRAERGSFSHGGMLWAELGESLREASELSWYARSAVENYPFFFNEVQSFISSQKKSARTNKKTKE